MTLSHLVSIKGTPSVITHSALEKPKRKEIIKEIVKCIAGKSKITLMPLFVELMTEMNAFLTDEHNERLKTELKDLKQQLIVS